MTYFVSLIETARGLNQRSAATRISMKRCLIPDCRTVVRATLFASAIAVTMAASGAPAAAQIYGPPVLREDAVIRQLRQQGFRQLTAPTLNGVVYYLDGIDPRGQPVRIIARAADARILALHPQAGGRWTRIDPEEDRDWIERRWNRRESRRRDDDGWNGGPFRERHSRLPDGAWRDEDWSDRRRFEQPDAWSERDARQPSKPQHERHRTPMPEIDGGSAENAAPPARRSPERVTVTPLPPPSATRDPDLPAPTIKHPTVVKRSPTAIPRDALEGKTGDPKRKIGTEASRTDPGVGTRENPRVIDLAPSAPKAPAGATPPASSPAPKAAATPVPRPAAPNPTAPAQILPPPAVLEAPTPTPGIEPRMETPTVPPAPLE